MVKENIIIQRSKEELEEIKKEALEQKFKLKEQPNFKGSEEMLLFMQQAERKYREGKPIISDEEWDELVSKTNYEESLDEIVSPNGRTWVKLGAPLGSLNKINDMDRLKSHLEQYMTNGFITEPKLDGLTYNAIYRENKNGLFELDKITTRGDGINGLALWEDALKYVEKKYLPDIISKETGEYLKDNGFVQNNRIEISGEAVVDKSFYSNKSEEYWNDIIPRSIAAGIFNRKIPSNLEYFVKSNFKEGQEDFTPKEIRLIKSKSGYKNFVPKKVLENDIIGLENGEEKSLYEYLKSTSEGLAFDKLRYKEQLYFFMFSIVDNKGNRIDDLEVFKNLPDFQYVGFHEAFKDLSYQGKSIDEFQYVIKCIDNLYGTKNFIRDTNLERKKLTSKFPMDGIVIKPIGSNTESQNMEPYEKAGKIIVPKYPKDQIAVKLPTDASRTKILKINYKTTKLGNITVSADIIPTKVEGGAVVSNVNLHNPDWLKAPDNQWIKEGVEAELRMAYDIIPILSEVK